MSHNIDVTGLSPEVVRAVEKLVAALREECQGQGRTSSGSEVSKCVDRWIAVAEAVKGLTDYDFDAWAKQRELDRQHGQDHLK